MCRRLSPAAHCAASWQGLDNYRLPVLASDVQQAVKALGHDSCTLVAHDWGGLVAWVVAGTNSSELVKQLVVMALPHTGIAMTNGSLKQKLRQLYVLLFQVGWPEKQVPSAA